MRSKLPDSDICYIEENIYQKNPLQTQSQIPFSQPQLAPASNSHTNSPEAVKLGRHSCLGLPHTNIFQPLYFATVLSFSQN